MLKSDNKDVQEHACGALRNLSMKREVSRKIGEEGALPYMIGLLRSPDERIQEQVLALHALYLLFWYTSTNADANLGHFVQAATLIRNLSVNDDNKNRIAQAGGLAPLIILLSSPLPRIQEQAPFLSRTASLRASGAYVLNKH